MFGGSELLIVAVIGAVLFGGSQIARKMGKAKTEFKKAKLEGEKEIDEIKEEIEEEED